MTTIATDGKSMAVDSYCTSSSIFHTEVIKIARTNNGDVIACAGTPYDLLNFLNWCNQTDKILEVTQDFEGLILRKDGTVWCVNEKGYMFQHDIPAACGSGCPVAYGAMDAGATPEQAVQIACRRDVKTGGTVRVMKI